MLALGVLFLWGGSGQERSEPATAAAPRDPITHQPADPVRVAARGPLARSLGGTEVDGALRVDGEGHLVPEPDTLALFDYFLSASGEEPPAVIRRRILDRIHDELGEPAAAEAQALLDRYLGFREALRALVTSSEVPRDLERRWQWLRELRRAHFGAATAEALFGREEDRVRVDLERRRVAMDAGLTPAERSSRLEALEAELPEDVRQARRRARAPAASHREVLALRAAGGSDAEVFRARERAFGSAAAERLAALDVRRASWDARLAHYRAERRELHEGKGAEPAELDRLRARHFEAHELARVRALDGFDPVSPR